MQPGWAASAPPAVLVPVPPGAGSFTGVAERPTLHDQGQRGARLASQAMQQDPRGQGRDGSLQGGWRLALSSGHTRGVLMRMGQPPTLPPR